MDVSILISTFNERIKNVKKVLLPPRSDVEYIVSHQYTSESFKSIPEDLVRNDVRISLLKRGLKKCDLTAGFCLYPHWDTRY